jgi:magnesium-transporting ATPase (P-type)
MSVIVKDENGLYFLLSKGADSGILSILGSEEN